MHLLPRIFRGRRERTGRHSIGVLRNVTKFIAIVTLKHLIYKWRYDV